MAVQPLRSSSRSLDAALLRSLGARRIGGSGSEGEALPEALTKPPAGKEESDQNREEMREKLRIVKARPRPCACAAAGGVTGMLMLHAPVLLVWLDHVLKLPGPQAAHVLRCKACLLGLMMHLDRGTP